MVRGTGFEPAASCSQSRRATNCATPGYSVYLSGWPYSPKASALPTALHPDMKFSNCGQTCGQRRFLTSYRRGGKCCQPNSPKSFRVFRGLRPEPGLHAPKSRALPTALHPDIQFFCMIPREEGKSKFLVSVGGAVVKPDFSEVFQPGNFHRNLLSQGLPGVRFQGNG